MTTCQYDILTRAATINGQFSTDGNEAKLAYELLRAQLIEGEPILNQQGLPVSVEVLGITIAGRNVIENRYTRVKDWLLNMLSVVIGSALTLLVQRGCCQ